MVHESHRDFVISTKILAEIEDIKNFTADLTFEQYMEDTRTQKAVAMCLINIGELCGAYSQTFLNASPHIPWRQIRALRNIAAHKYEALRHADVWETVCKDIPTLQKDLESLLR